MDERSIAIIGAGIAGLSAGCYGQTNGFKTRLFEAHTMPGGVCAAWKRKGSAFDGCIHHLPGCQPRSGLYQLWEDLGAFPRPILFPEELVRAEGPDGKTLTVFTDLERLEEEMKRLAPEDGRASDVINVAGHRMGTREVEEVISAHPQVAEVSAIGVDDEVKGQEIAAFVVLKKGVEESEALKKEIVALIRDRIGPIATPKILNIVPQLPKTRSGKVMRRVLRALCEEKALGDLSTIEDGSSVEEIKKALEEMGQTGK